MDELVAAKEVERVFGIPVKRFKAAYAA